LYYLYILEPNGGSGHRGARGWSFQVVSLFFLPRFGLITNIAPRLLNKDPKWLSSTLDISKQSGMTTFQCLKSAWSTLYHYGMQVPSMAMADWAEDNQGFQLSSGGVNRPSGMRLLDFKVATKDFMSRL
jgi:hypothetical protein